MSDEQIKWIVVKELGSKTTQTKIMENKNIYRLLTTKSGTDNLQYISNYLIRLGFIVNNKDKESEIKSYFACRKANSAKIMKSYHASKDRDKRKLFE